MGKAGGGAAAKRAGGGDRTAFLNSAKSAAIAETIKKEERAVAAMFQKQLELGHLRLPSDGGEALIAAAGHCQAPEVAEPDFELIARLVGRPGETAGQEAEEEPATTRRERLQDISRSVWATSNPCFSERPAHFVSSAQADYAWRAEDVERMRTQGELSDKHHRKRDGFTQFAECALRNLHMQRRGGAGDAPKPQ